MATIKSPNAGFNGTRLGIQFKDGTATSREPRALEYFRSLGYEVDGETIPVARPMSEPSAPAPGTPANPEGITRQPASRDAAVEPNASGPVSDAFMPPTNAGLADPHGPQVVSPGLHAVPPAPIVPGSVHVGDPDAQERIETAVADAVLVQGADVPDVTQAVGAANSDTLAAAEDHPAADAEAVETAVAPFAPGAPGTDAVVHDTDVERPAKSANKPDWVAYAVAQGMTEDEANETSKAKLVERYGG